MTLERAAGICRSTGLEGWAMVAFAQNLVYESIRYSMDNSLDSPSLALEKGKGYCWHRARVLQAILTRMGISCRLVHAHRNLFPEVALGGVQVKNLVSGHVWCRVTIDGVEKDVCPGSANGVPGILSFQPLSRVQEWNRWIEFFAYYGSALVNARRRTKYRLRQTPT